MQGLVLEADHKVPGGRAIQLGQRAFDRGLLVYPGSGEGASPYGDHVLIGPPLVITEEEVATLLTMLDDRLAALL